MKLHWFLNGNGIFKSEGDVPLVGQIIYLNDYSTTPPIGKRKYKVIRVDRSITLSTKNINDLSLKSKDALDRYNEAILQVETALEGAKVVEVNPPLLKISDDIAEISLESIKGF